MMFAGGMCILALLGFMLRDWFYLSLATSLPFILLYGYYWLIPESPRWLVGRGRIAEAEKVFRNLARKNGIELPHGFLLELHKKIKEQEDAETRAIMLYSVNGSLTRLTDVKEKDEYTDRIITNMVTFKPDLSKIAEETPSKVDGLEKIIALEVVDIVNKKSCYQKEEEVEEGEENVQEESHSNNGPQQKATQTEPIVKSPANTLRRKSLQIVTRMLLKQEGDLENKEIDDQNSEGDCKASPLDIFRYPNLRKKLFILTFDWVVLGVVYNSLSYNTPNLGVDDYLAFFIGGAVELPSYFIAWRCMERYGRRWVLCVFTCIGGVACLSCVLVSVDWPWITVSLAMLGRLCIAASFAVFYVVIGELLPTVVRAQAMGSASVVAGLGLLACPYIVHLAVYSRVLPLTIMGILSVMAGVTVLFLPETLNQPLPQTLTDGEEFGREVKVFTCVRKQNNKP